MLLIKFKIDDPDQQLKQASNCDYDLWNPHSKVLSLILYIFSIQPSFQSSLQKAHRNDVPDKASLRHLGSLSMALHVLLKGAEEQRKDSLQSGSCLGCDGPLGLFAGSILAFRGALLSAEDLREWTHLCSL